MNHVSFEDPGFGATVPPSLPPYLLKEKLAHTYILILCQVKGSTCKIKIHAWYSLYVGFRQRLLRVTGMPTLHLVCCQRS